MGCSPSKSQTLDDDDRPSTALPPVRPSTNNRASRKTPSPTTLAPPPVVPRERTDSWAIPVKPSVETQWSSLWETLSPLLVDPADVPAVLDSLLSAPIEKLSPVMITALQRHVRALHQQQQSKTMMPSTSKIRVFGSEKEAKTDRPHNLLNMYMIGKILPAPVIQDNAMSLLTHLSSESLWERVAEIAAHAASKADLVVDVNVRHMVMPKPSVVPDVEPVESPKECTFPALCWLIAVATHGTRTQRLQLLFYLLLPDLNAFLRNHPAGGVPVWLLEADAHTVVSLASLTHYHYYGNACLPVEHALLPHVASQSRQPLKVSAKQVQALVRYYVLDDDEANLLVTAETAPAATASDTANTSVHGNKPTSSRVVEPAKSPLQHRLLSPVHDPASERTKRQIRTNLSVGDATTESTLEEYILWCNRALNEEALDLLMYRLVGEGLLPTPRMEREWVQEVWYEWHRRHAAATGQSLTSSVRALLDPYSNGDDGFKPNLSNLLSSVVFGGLGGIDGGGGLGHGVLYCIDKSWWDAWTKYVGWSWVGDRPQEHSLSLHDRPASLSTEHLLDSQGDLARGSLGSFEAMKPYLQRDVDYVLIPPPAWDVLYELYGGGPPLPRHVKPPERKIADRLSTNISDNGYRRGEPVDLDDLVESFDRSVDQSGEQRVERIPNSVAIVVHPWLLQVQLCDPSQPYRRGEAGPLSIRVMVTADEPVWRLFAELIARFPLQAYKAFANDGRGRARLWRKVDRTGPQDPVPRYGPWNLLCKSRSATLPLLIEAKDLRDNYKDLVKDWKEYTDNATVDGIGLCDRDNLMLEFAVVNKNGELFWPREAAAKAGRVRRIADEDMEFRQTLQGVDEKGSLLIKPLNLVGMDIDAMDANGRWYPVTILEAEVVDEDTDEEADNDERSNSKGRGVSRKKVRVDFTPHGGHQEWIDVDSDRLAVAGRFTNESERRVTGAGVEGKTNGSSASVSSDTKLKPTPPVKKASGEGGTEIGKICLWPSYGACGLTNLGNTCYVNAAIQCISYLPLLRSYLLSAQYKTSGDLNKDNPLGTGGKLLEEFAELLRILWSAKVGEKSPARFRTQLGKINAQFSGGDQQDAQEFLSYILDVLHEDSNKVRKKPYVEALEDEWVAKTKLPRVGDEAWRRFLRRNRSIMSDVAMGQVLNTVTCPVCKFSSRNFDPFNLLSIPIPTVAFVVFKCTVFRRATAMNCPWILNKSRKGDKGPFRFIRRVSSSPVGPPSERNVAEQYVIAMSRLADSGDLRLQIQNSCGIPANQLRLCRAEVVQVKPDDDEDSVVNCQVKVIALADKEGPCSQLAKERVPGSDESAAPVTMIVAFESTVRPRLMPTPGESEDAEALEETADEDDEGDHDEDPIVITPLEQEQIKRYLDVYGDEQECRVVDTNPLILAKAVSRSLWPRTDSELKLGLRVDARDHRGNWFPGNVVDLVDEKVNGGEFDAVEHVTIRTRKVRVHFDNFSPKWDEMYSIEHFEQGSVRPLYSHASPRSKPTEFLVHNRHTDRNTGHSVVFGQSYYVQCQNEWTNARAGAHILAQASRFLRHDSGWGSIALDDPGSTDREARARRLYEKTHGTISDLIDLLVDCDKEYVRLALGVSEHSRNKETSQPFRNPSFDPSSLSDLLIKKVSSLLHRLPFEIRLCTVDTQNSEKAGSASDEMNFPFSLTRTIGNFINARHAIILHWREPPIDKKTGSTNSYLDAPVLYVEPKVEVDRTSAEMLKAKSSSSPKMGKGGSAGIDLGVCLTEFCKVQNLTLADNWKCPHCKKFREGRQSMSLWRLPDLLTFHIKRFNMSARWREKITTKVNFPLTGFDMSEWCLEDSPAMQYDPPDSHVYDLIGVVNHYGSMTGGHYVAACKATICGRDGREEVGYSFNGVGTNVIDHGDADEPTGWRIGRPKAEVNQSKVTAAVSAQSASDSVEPLWLQFDDELVEPIPPRLVVSEMAYVLFYRRRRMTPSNIAKYSTVD